MSRAWRLTENLEGLSRATLMEMLHAVAKTLARLHDCPHFSALAAGHIARAERHVDAVVSAWTDEVEAGNETRRAKLRPATAEDPVRGRGHVLDMLAIYHDEMNDRDFTPLQQQRILIAAYNLAVVAGELMPSVH